MQCTSTGSSVVVAHGLQSTGAIVAALRLKPMTCGILAPSQGIKLTQPVLEGRFSTTGPLGKSLNHFLSLVTTARHCLQGPTSMVRCHLVHQFSCSVVSDSLQPHELQYARLPCPSPTPRACSNSSIESVMPFNHLILSSPSPPAFNFPQHQGLF